MTPESRIARDLGLSVDDLRRLADDRRMRRLAPRMAHLLRKLGGGPNRVLVSCTGLGDELDGLLTELDPPPLVKLGPGGDFTREIRT